MISLQPPAPFTCTCDDEAVRAFPPLKRDLDVLLVWPRFPPSFWGFEGMMAIMPERAVLPPLGLITVAAMCPPRWRLRLLDRAFEPITDADIRRADLVLVSAMHAQRADVRDVLARSRALGRRTIIGGPYASSQPEALMPFADHVVVGEVDECFGAIVDEIETGRARRRYTVAAKPDVTRAPVPRFDLLRPGAYAAMSVQFSRGCPFQCEFCDIITIYGRRPRTKSPAQLLSELEALYRLGWKRQIFIVDDNFSGNHRLALALAQALAAWQREREYPFSFLTEASIDLAERPELLDSMAEANFLQVFVGIESPSPESLREARKYQNLRHDVFDQIRRLQRSGLWIMGGFIVGFDSDDERTFARLVEFIERAAIPWAMSGVLQAPPTTALFERLRREGRLDEDSDAITNFSPPNFRTVMPVDALMGGLRAMLLELYRPDRFFARALRSIECWRPRAVQRTPLPPLRYRLRIAAGSVWRQGVASRYRSAYWRYLAEVFRRWRRDPQRRWMALLVLLSAHHFIQYAEATARDIGLRGRGVPSAP